jgi:hypothetical protein
MFCFLIKKKVLVLIIIVIHTLSSVSQLFCNTRETELVVLRGSKFDTSLYEMKLFEQNLLNKIIHSSCMNKTVWTVCGWRL